ncbi:MAG: hypothetical protein ACOYLE_08070 [Bacteroidales bacterium]
MKKLFRLIILLTVIASCSTIKKADRETDKNSISSTVARDGTSLKKAIVITEKNERAGILAENDWIRKNYIGYRKTGQSLVFNKDRPFDIIKIENAEGTANSIYFDISSFFGKN